MVQPPCYSVYASRFVLTQVQHSHLHSWLASALRLRCPCFFPRLLVFAEDHPRSASLQCYLSHHHPTRPALGLPQLEYDRHDLSRAHRGPIADLPQPSTCMPTLHQIESQALPERLSRHPPHALHAILSRAIPPTCNHCARGADRADEDTTNSLSSRLLWPQLGCCH